MHRDYGCVRFRELVGTSEQISYEDVLEIIKEAVEIEDQFADMIAPTPIEDFSAATTKKFNRFMANNLLIGLGYDAYWVAPGESEYPSWMQSIASSEKGNFYEVNIGAYKQFAVGSAGGDNHNDSSLDSSLDSDDTDETDI
jgi:ribonucleotide reductase beta subunit family protein with ferritin-like domain